MTAMSTLQVGAMVGPIVLDHLVFLVVEMFRLAFAVRGAPDQGKIRAFAASVGPAGDRACALSLCSRSQPGSLAVPNRLW